MRTNEIKNEIDQVRKWEEKFIIFINISNKYLYDFQQFETIRSFGDSIYIGKTNIDETEIDQSNLLENMVKFNNKSKPKIKEGKAKRQNTFDSLNALYEGRELTLNSFRSGIFLMKATQRKGRPRMLASRPLDLTKRLKILTTKEMLQKLPMPLAQVQASEKLLNAVRQIIHSSHRAEEITKRVYNNIVNSIKL